MADNYQPLCRLGNIPDGRFLTKDGTLIQCSTHGAKFGIEDGICVSGPCQGDRLKPVKTEIRDGHLYLL